MATDLRPIFLTGTGRCGSTIFQSMLAMHPDVAWTSTWTELMPSAYWMAVFHRTWDLPGFDRFRQARFFPKPAEPQAAFRHYLRDPHLEEVTAEAESDVRDHLRPYLEKLASFHGKQRFVMKLAGRPVKIRLMDRAFPGAIYTDLKRDLKATVSSVLRVPFYTSWGDLEDWPWEEIPPPMLDFHLRTNRSEAVGVAIGLKLNRLEIERQLDEIAPSRRLTVNYSEFVTDPVGHLRRVAEAAALRFPSDLASRLEARHIRKGANEKWKNFLSDEDVAYLDEFEDTFGF